MPLQLVACNTRVHAGESEIQSERADWRVGDVVLPANCTQSWSEVSRLWSRLIVAADLAMLAHDRVLHLPALLPGSRVRSTTCPTHQPTTGPLRNQPMVRQRR